MPKHLIIDGYNLLGLSSRASLGVGPEGEVFRETLLWELAGYRQRMGYPMTVVFDAWRRVGGTQHYEHRAGLTVIFSRQGERADQVIQRIVRKYGEDCVVVSSDHEVMNVAHAHGALVIRSQEFLPKLRPPSASCFQQSSVPKPDEEPSHSRGPKKKGNPRKLPKSVRNRIRSLRKF